MQNWLSSTMTHYMQLVDKSVLPILISLLYIWHVLGWCCLVCSWQSLVKSIYFIIFLKVWWRNILFNAEKLNFTLNISFYRSCSYLWLLSAYKFIQHQSPFASWGRCGSELVTQLHPIYPVSSLSFKVHMWRNSHADLNLHCKKFTVTGSN